MRVLSPGDNGPVDQRNTSSAAAVAGATGGSGASATSTSTQVAPTNLNVSIRVGSPGNDGARTQLNSSDATSTLADPATVAPTLGPLPDPNTANGAADVENVSSVVQSLAQCGDQCPASSTQPSGAGTAPASGAGTSNATATQQAPTNIDVSIRVASPNTGADGLPSQKNSAHAKGETSVETVSTPTNLVVTIVVPGVPKHVKVPTGNTPWIWNWTWTTGQAPTDPSATDTSGSTWEWTWTIPGAGAADASGQPQSGTWTWTWTWTRPDGTTTTWTYSQACSCSWAWTWTWDWPATTTSNAPAAQQTAQVASPPSNPTVSQTNESSATAVALTTSTGTQSIAVTTESTSGATTSADLGISSVQAAEASADVAQARPRNTSIVTAGEIDGVQQLNRVAGTAISTVSDESLQRVAQAQVGMDDGATHSLAAVQRIETVQSTDAGVSATQSDARNINQVWSVFGPSAAKLGKITQQNTAETLSIADAESAVRQAIDQAQFGGGADQDASATQIALTSQQQTATSSVSQARVTNWNDVSIPLNGIWNPPIEQSNSVSTVSLSYATSTIDQSATQGESGDGIEWHATSTQNAVVKQSGAAGSNASQSDRTTTGGWGGTTGSPGVPTSSGGSFEVPTTLLAYASSPAPVVTSTPQHRLGGARAAVKTVIGSWGFAVTRLNASSPAVVHWSATVSTHPRLSAAGHPAQAETGTSGSPERTPLPMQHKNLNLVGTQSTAPPALLSAGFAALLAPIKLAAPGVGRLQRDAPVLGRPVDTALRERPG